MSRARNHLADLRGVTRLAIEATHGVTDLVEAMHVAIGGGPALLRQPLAGPVRAAIAPVFGGIRAVTALVGGTLDAALARLAPLLGDGVPGPEREAVLAALNGVLGDYLSATGNPLALEMQLHAPPPADRGPRLAVLVHGSSMSYLQWTRLGHHHGTALARDLGLTPVIVAYNSGLHISTNGRTLAALLEALVASWPVPVDEIVLVGHSMGGLVARSACHVAEQAHHAWRTRVTRLVTIGAPHHGAPLERAGNWADVLLGVTRYSAPLARLGKIRSAGVTDLRHGNVLDEHWAGRDRFAPGGDGRTPLPLPEGVATLAIAGTTAAAVADRPPGDGLVPVASALGQHPRAALRLAFDRTVVVPGTNHLDLLSSPAVYQAIRDWLAAAEPR